MTDIKSAELEIQNALAPSIHQVRGGDLASLSPGILSGHLAMCAGNLPRLGWLCSEAYKAWLLADADARMEKAKAYSTYRAQGMSPSASKQESEMFPGYLEAQSKASILDGEHHRLKLLREDIQEVTQALKLVLRVQQDEMRLAGREQ